MQLKYKNQIREKYRYQLVKFVFFLGLVMALGTGVMFANNDLPKLLMQLSDLTHSKGRVLAATFDERSLEPADVTSIKTSYKLLDWRAYVLDEYFRYYNSPLYGTGEIFVSMCEKYNAPKDCTTVAAIAHAETDLCKYYNSASYYNCWGFGGAGPNRIYFRSWDESIDRVTRSLTQSYGTRFMINPSLMERTFCGSEPGCTNWGKRVLHFMEKISDFPLQLGFKQRLFELRD